MPYIGRGPAKSGAFRIIDDISGDFNGSTTSFALEVGSAALTVGLPETLLIAVDGVLQEAGSAYTISGSNIVFTAAPQADATFWGVELGDVGGLAERAITQSAGDDSTKIATTAYVDTQVATEDTLAEMGDVNLTSPGDAAILVYDTATSTWRDAAMGGDATIGDTGAVTVASSHSGSAHHADAHTVASHSDTTGTGAEVETLTDGSNAESLHTHTHTVVSHSDTTATGAELETLTDGSTTALHAHSGGGIASVAADTTPQVGGSAGFDLQAQLLVGNGGTTGIAVSSAGAVTMAAQPTVSLHHSAAQTVAGSTTTAIAFDAENWKVGDSTQHDNSTNNSRLYARTAGKYLCAGTVSYSNNNSGWRYMEIAVNGSEKAFDTRQAVQGNRTRVNMSYLADLDAGDYVEFRAYQTSGSTLNIERTGNEPNFWFIKVA